MYKLIVFAAVLVAACPSCPSCRPSRCPCRPSRCSCRPSLPLRRRRSPSLCRCPRWLRPSRTRRRQLRSSSRKRGRRGSPCRPNCREGRATWILYPLLSKKGHKGHDVLIHGLFFEKKKLKKMMCDSCSANVLIELSNIRNRPNFFFHLQMPVKKAKRPEEALSGSTASNLLTNSFSNFFNLILISRVSQLLSQVSFFKNFFFLHPNIPRSTAKKERKIF